MNQASIFLTADDNYYVYDFTLKQLFSKVDAANTPYFSSASFPTLSEKDKRLLLEGTNVIMPRSNKIIIQLDRIPIIISRDRVLGGADRMYAYIFVSLEYTPQSQSFIESFEKLLLDVSETQAVSEFSVLEVLLTFISESLNAQYSRILLEYSEFNYYVHAETNNQLSLMRTECSHLLGLLDDLLGNQSEMALLLFANQDALAEEAEVAAGATNMAGATVSSRTGSVASEIERMGIATTAAATRGTANTQGNNSLGFNATAGLASSAEGPSSAASLHAGMRSNSRTQSTDNLKALSEQQIRDARNVEEVEEALDSYQTEFRTIENEIAEMQSKMELYLQEAQIEYDTERNYIVEFALKQKIINVAITATSLIGAIFGENLVFRFGFDNEEWTSISPVPFICLLAASAVVFCLADGIIMFNYKKRSMLHIQDLKKTKSRWERHKKAGYTSINTIVVDTAVRDILE